MNRRSFLRSSLALPFAVAGAGCTSALDPGTSSTPAIGDRDVTPYTDGTEAWPGYGFDPGNTWHNPDVTLLGESPSTRRITSGGSRLGTTPGSTIAVAGNRLYFGTVDGQIVSYATTGERLWTDSTRRRTGVHTTPSLTRDVLFVTTETETTALSATGGSRLWTSDAFVRSGTSVLADDRLYATTDDALVAALEVETGDTAWTITDEELRGDDEEREDSTPVVGAMGVAEDTVYTTGSWDREGHVMAIADGEKRWWREGFDLVTRPPAIGEDVIAVTTGSTVYGLDRDDGDTVWEYSLPSEWSVAQGVTPAIAHGHVYVGGPKTTCLDLETGETRWHVETGRCRTPPVAVEDGLYVGTLEGLFALEPDGTLRWHDETVRTERPVTAVDDRLYAVVSAGPLGTDDVYELADR